MTNTASKYFLSSWALEFCSFDSSFQAEKNWQVKQEKRLFFSWTVFKPTTSFRMGTLQIWLTWNVIPLHSTSYFVTFVKSKLFEYIHEVVWTKLVKNLHVIHISIIPKTCISKSACHKLIHT